MLNFCYEQNISKKKKTQLNKEKLVEYCLTKIKEITTKITANILF